MLWSPVIADFQVGATSRYCLQSRLLGTSAIILIKADACIARSTKAVNSAMAFPLDATPLMGGVNCSADHLKSSQLSRPTPVAALSLSATTAWMPPLRRPLHHLAQKTRTAPLLQAGIDTYQTSKAARRRDCRVRAAVQRSSNTHARATPISSPPLRAAVLTPDCCIAKFA